MIDGVIANMVVAVELTQKVIDPMIARKFGRIVNITSGSVKMPLAGLDLSSGARAGLTAFIAGVARSVAASNVTINFLSARHVRHRSAAVEHRGECQERGISVEQAKAERMATVPAKRFGTPDEFGGGLRLPVLGAGRLHHRSESPDRRRRVPGRDVRAQTRTRPALAGLVAPPKLLKLARQDPEGRARLRVAT